MGTGSDTDGDGILDGLDVCPEVADPAQLDLDGDGIGWSCDASESTTLPFSASPHALVDVQGLTFAAVVSYNCPAVGALCTQELVAAGPTGWREVTSTSTDPLDAWARVGNLIPFISLDEHLYWSQYGHHIGELDLATGTFVDRYAGFVDLDSRLRPSSDSGAPFGIRARFGSVGFSTAFLEPRQDGSLQEIARSTNIIEEPLVARPSSPELLVALTDDDGPSIKRFTPGSNTLSTVSIAGVPMTQLTVTTGFGGLGTKSAYCAIKNGTVFFIEASAVGIRGGVVPRSSCPSLMSSSETRFVHALQDSSWVGLAIDGQITGLPDASSTVEFVGRETPVLVLRDQGVPVAYYAMDSTGTSRELASGVEAPVVSSEGSTVHILGRRGNTRVLVRYRVGQTPQEIVLPIPATTNATLVTTKQGAALVGAGTVLVVPSQSLTPRTLGYDSVFGGVRGDHTILGLIAANNLSIYAYDEDAAGDPQLTQLVAPAVATDPFGLTFLDRDGQTRFTPSDWFLWWNRTECHFARATTSGGTVVLAGVAPCAGNTQYTIRGETADGTQVVANDSGEGTSVYLLNSSAQKVAVGQDVKFMTDGSNHITGWYGRDAAGGFVCIASHPDRCWSVPVDLSMSLQWYWTTSGTTSPTAIHLVIATFSSTTVTFTSIKSVGTGNRLQPL